MKLPKCPYCGKKVGYLSAFFMHNQGEYCCKKCKKESNVIIKKALLIPFIFAVLFAIAILLYFLVMTNRQNLWFMLFIAIPFIIFYLLTPGFVVLKPKKKFMDSLYDTEMVESPIADPDPTMAKTSKVIPTFVDDVILEDEEYKPSINKDVFDAIKKERKSINDTDGGTKAFSKYEDISSSEEKDKTMPVENIKKIKPKKKEISDTALILQNIDDLINEENNKEENIKEDITTSKKNDADEKIEKEKVVLKENDSDIKEIIEEKENSEVKTEDKSDKEEEKVTAEIEETEVVPEKKEEKTILENKEVKKEKEEIIKEEKEDTEVENDKDYDLSLFM